MTTEQTFQRIVDRVSNADIPISVLVANTVIVDAVTSDLVVAETVKDLSSNVIRSMLGLSPVFEKGSEPIWDAPMVNRLTGLNIAMVVAEKNQIDVVEFEGGLSRLATEKFFTNLKFDRQFKDSEAFDRLWRTTNIPDASHLVPSLGIAAIAEVSDSPAGCDFRNWFWDGAAVLAGSGASISDSFEKKLSNSFLADTSPTKVLAQLKWRLIERVGGDYILGGFGKAARGFSSRAESGARRLRIQARLHGKRKSNRIRQIINGGVPSPYDPCPCGSTSRFRFCCGNPIE